MPTRRTLITALLATTLALPAFAQGKKLNSSEQPRANGRDLSGWYDATGRNPDGSAYQGRAEIFHRGDNISITWFIGDDAPNKGTGSKSGDVVTVDWGDTTPVVYVVMPDGELHGTWADGTAIEKLTPE